jgi:hypothetical protein
MTVDPLQIGRESTLSAHEKLHPISVCYFDSDKHELASGILIEIGSHLFVATVAHSIPSSPEKRLWVLPETPKRAEDGMLGFVKFGKEPSEHPDVGFLELTREAAAVYLPNSRPIGLDDIKDFGIGRENSLVFVIGFPAEWAQARRTAPETLAMPAHSLCYTTTPLPHSEWPAVPKYEPPADITIDAFLIYPADGTTRADTNADTSLPDPHGMSGGGFWDAGFENGSLWTPGSAKLFAIQVLWNSTQRYLRGVQISHWLRLIHRDYPALRPLLESKFSGVDGGPQAAKPV